VPLAAFHASGLTLGNSAYKYLSVAYIQILKSLSPVMILLVAFIIGKEKPSIIQLSIVCVICGGVVLASTGELQFSLVGFILQLSAILTDVGRMTLIDNLMVDIKLDSLSMLYYLSPLSSVMIFLGFLFFELDGNFPWARIFLDPQFGGALVLSGVLAFCLNIAVFVGVAHSSSVIIGVSGLIKDMILVVSSVVFFGSPITLQQIVGYMISIVGLTYYREYRSDPQKVTNRILALLAKAGAALRGEEKISSTNDESDSFLAPSSEEFACKSTKA
jgi:drug/metabolite transporter (DMT)-like permease